MNGYVVLGAIGVIISYQGYCYVKKRINDYVFSEVKRQLDEKLKNEEELFKPSHSSSVIKFQTGGKTHSVYVPYNSKKSSAMLLKKFYLIKGDEKIELCQKPGIPFLVTASDLGGEKIVVEDREGEIIKIYSENEIPQI